MQPLSVGVGSTFCSWLSRLSLSLNTLLSKNGVQGLDGSTVLSDSLTGHGERSPPSSHSERGEAVPPWRARALTQSYRWLFAILTTHTVVVHHGFSFFLPAASRRTCTNPHLHSAIWCALRAKGVTPSSTFSSMIRVLATSKGVVVPELPFAESALEWVAINEEWRLIKMVYD